jgi:hypothetical protein
MNSKARKTIAAAAAALSLAFASVGIAEAATTQSVSIHYSGDGFYGKIKSNRASCLANRKVSVFKHRRSGDTKLYTDTSDTNGHWDTGNSGQAKGRFYAAVNASSRCGPITSSIIRVP